MVKVNIHLALELTQKLNGFLLELRSNTFRSDSYSIWLITNLKLSSTTPKDNELFAYFQI
jgi:hypothetical protein